MPGSKQGWNATTGLSSKPCRAWDPQIHLGHYTSPLPSYMPLLSSTQHLVVPCYGVISHINRTGNSQQGDNLEDWDWPGSINIWTAARSGEQLLSPSNVTLFQSHIVSTAYDSSDSLASLFPILVVSIAVGAILVLAFTLLRYARKGKFPHAHESRSSENRADIELLKHTLLEVYFLLRYIKLALLFCFAGCLIAWPIIFFLSMQQAVMYRCILISYPCRTW